MAADPFLRRFERDAVVACLLMAVVALLLPGGGWRAGAGVLGGGLLSAVSYRGIRGVVAPVAGEGGRAALLVKFFTRHAILAVAAYVMLARFGLHPLGLIAGATSLVAAAGVAAARGGGQPSRPGNPR